MEEMTPRERVLKALNFEETDRVPHDLGGTNNSAIHIDAYNNLLKCMGMKHEDMMWMHYGQHLARPSEEVLEKLGVDVRGVYPSAFKRVGGVPDPVTIDKWGLEWRYNTQGHYYDAVNFPLEEAEDIDAIRKYDFPDGTQLLNMTGVADYAEHLHKENRYATVGYFGSSIFMQAQLLRGYGQLFEDMMADDELFMYLMQRILDVRLQMAQRFLDECGKWMDVVVIADDIAAQNGLMFSMDMYHRLVMPYTKALIDGIHLRTDAKILYHSCGAVSDFLSDFEKIGINAVNPVQVSAKGMENIEKLKADHDRKLTFWGGIDTQHLLPNASPEEVREKAIYTSRVMGKNGGYVLCPSHNIHSDIPSENIVSMYTCDL